MPDARSRRRRDKRKARVARPPRVKHLYFLIGAAIGAIGGGIAAIAWMGANNPDAIAPATQWLILAAGYASGAVVGGYALASCRAAMLRRSQRRLRQPTDSHGRRP